MYQLSTIIIGYIIFFIIFFYIAYKLHNILLKKKGKKPSTFFSFMNGKDHWNQIGIEKLMVGFIFGILFGFIDNVSLWSGIDILHKYIPGDMLVKSGVGNIIADTTAATISTVISILVIDYYGYDISDIPIWANSVAIMLGCILGLFFGKIVIGGFKKN
jgi:hypothetical protein